ncbi:multifunctional fatty acid oxidation complex subunit alpha [Catenovulum agarivorans DS-2]|uniref:enoyl-CoA hydratase n=1 Tax=Catenovulum agarivorans DS-2 TaxID=1328313 RepID=W7QIC6_9ALTE|nr:fatty acid oxidation complex subunit alpha FadB [Catenovulum agarivorans]EWH11601.1 multifunctional fatty acid oxidation complex subunit alpha [Catenovulum agarivorans DS-2]
MLFQSNNIQLVELEQQIGELILNAQGSVNKFDKETLEAFRCAIEKAQQSQLKALVLTSTKPAFIVGADITEFLDKFALPQTELLSWIKYATDIFDALEDLPFPTVSAINGYALGGGCETILATDFRIADTQARIGLPEVKLGIMPGFGGTVRMSRLLGADNAMELITTGKELKAADALKLSLVDAVVEPEILREAAIDCAVQAANGQFNWQQRRQQKLSALSLNKTENAMSFALAKSMVMQKAGSHYPAPLKAVETIEQGSKLARDDAMRIENENFVELTQTPQAQALVGLFLADQQVKSLAKSAKKLAAPVQTAAVLGAGIMGGGIAYQAASRQHKVILKDINANALDLGMQEAAKLLNKAASMGKISAEQAAQSLIRIQPTLEHNALKPADIVVEAVVENANVKAKVLAETEQTISDHAVLATNTSTISIDLLAQDLQRPANFCGMHFFNPVHKMPLVEVIRGSKTSEQTIATVVEFAKKMGKTPIVVNDCPGFFVNRVLFPYLAAFNQLMFDGADLATVDKVMEKRFGWPMGPAYLLDVIGLDTAFHAQSVMAKGFPTRMPMPSDNLLKVLVDAQRLGQKSGSGFYRYELDNKGKLQKRPDDYIATHLQQAGVVQQTFNEQQIIDRLMMPMINECILCLEQGIVASAEEADMALIYGLGFPPFRGGVFRYLQQLGLKSYITRAKSYEHLGPAYQLSDSLLDKAKSNLQFLATK